MEKQILQQGGFVVALGGVFAVWGGSAIFASMEKRGGNATVSKERRSLQKRI